MISYGGFRDTKPSSEVPAIQSFCDELHDLPLARSDGCDLRGIGVFPFEVGIRQREFRNQGGGQGVSKKKVSRMDLFDSLDKDLRSLFLQNNATRSGLNGE